ncbi:peptide transport protein [Citrobacter freundii]|nr:peptide transport protein [Citrobacter freundii]
MTAVWDWHVKMPRRLWVSLPVRCTSPALPGGWLADNWLGQQKAVWYGSILIALGHLSIALSAIMGNNLFFIGLMFIVLGSGLFKTCISVMVGTLYKKGDARRDGGFSLFYMGINMGVVYRAADFRLA